MGSSCSPRRLSLTPILRCWVRSASEWSLLAPRSHDERPGQWIEHGAGQDTAGCKLPLPDTRRYETVELAVVALQQVVKSCVAERKKSTSITTEVRSCR